MIALEDLYFEWLLTQIDPDGVPEGVSYYSGLLLDCTFRRRVGNDVNRAANGISLRHSFLRDYDQVGFDPSLTNSFLTADCTWLEMLISLSQELDYLYDGGVLNRYLELAQNMGLSTIHGFRARRTERDYIQDASAVALVTGNIDDNRIDQNGHGGLFPLMGTDHPDQREVELWDQHAAYFRERLEGGLWTSTR